MRQAIKALRLLLVALPLCAATTLLAGDRAIDERAPASAVGEAAPISPPIVSREKWNARPPSAGMKPQRVTGIILHHTAARMSLRLSVEQKMRGLQAFSQRPGQVSPSHAKPAWPDVPYHFYVDARGHVAEGRDVRFAGDTNTKYDPAGYIQVVVEGDFEKESPAPAQMAVLRDLLVWLALSWDVPGDKIGVHKSFASTTCPGRNFIAMLPDLLAQVENQRRKVVNDVCAFSPTAARSAICDMHGQAPRRRAQGIPQPPL